mgnify:CR=1 FL=1
MIDTDELVEPAPGAGPMSTTTTLRPDRANSRATELPITPAPITIARLIRRLNEALDERTVVVAEENLTGQYRSLIEANLEDLAKLVTRENGKTLEEARGDVRRGKLYYLRGRTGKSARITEKTGVVAASASQMSEAEILGGEEKA